MSRKKKKKPGQRRVRLTFPARYGVGTQVRVKPGIAHPDYADIPLGGWAGAITEVNQRSNPPTYLIEWNPHTLGQMHPVYCKRCERDGQDLEDLWLGEANLEPDSGEPAVIEQPTTIITRSLSKDDQDDRIRTIFGLTSDDPLPAADVEHLGRYGHSLQSQLSFPFQARYTVEIGPFKEAKYLVTIVGLLDPDQCDEDDGVVCQAEEEGELIELPLVDLEVPSDPYNRQLVEDYSYWACNWPADSSTERSDVDWMSVDADTGPPTRWAVPKALVRYGLRGASYGVVLGALLGSLEHAITGATVGAIVLGLVGLAVGTKYGRVFGAVNQVRYGSLGGGALGTTVGVLLGAVVGAMVVGFVGSLVGGGIGALVGRLLEKWKWSQIGKFWGAVIGAGVGSVVVACYQDQENALACAFHGAWIGASSGIFLVVAAVGFLAWTAPRRNR